MWKKIAREPRGERGSRHFFAHVRLVIFPFLLSESLEQAMYGVVLALMLANQATSGDQIGNNFNL